MKIFDGEPHLEWLNYKDSQLQGATKIPTKIDNPLFYPNKQVTPLVK